VVRAGTSDPVVGAQVTLTLVTNPVFGDAPAAFPADTAAARPGAPPAYPVQTTGADGKFVFKDLGEGAYRVAAIANGYVRQEYGQRSTNSTGRAILIADQSFKDAAIQLIPLGSLIGRISDESGQPAMGAPVQLLRPVYSAQGRTLQSAGTAVVDDRGDYRIFGVPPGRYYLAAGTTPGPNRPLALGGTPAGASRYELTFHPNVRDIEQAAMIEISGGLEASMNMTVKRQPQGYRISGTVIDSATGKPLPAVNISVSYRGIAGGSGAFGGNAYDPATGNFQMQNIWPGEYTVVASVPSQGPIRGDATAIEARRLAMSTQPAASAAIRVVDADVANIVLTMRPGVTLNGRVTVEGQSLASVTGLDRMRIGFGVPVVNMGSPEVQPAGADGAFQIVGVREGVYRITPQQTPPGFYVKSIQFEGEDILSNPFRFSGIAGGTINVTLRPGPVRITGTVTDSKSQPVPANMVALVPAESGRIDLYRQSMTDPLGKFTFPDTPPGRYRIFSWDSFEAGSQFNPEFIERFEQQGLTVTVVEGTPQDVSVRLIVVP
jgi:protocatechuate 3,4-dioxygenase beta subunit